MPQGRASHVNGVPVVVPTYTRMPLLPSELATNGRRKPDTLTWRYSRGRAQRREGGVVGNKRNWCHLREAG